MSVYLKKIEKGGENMKEDKKEERENVEAKKETTENHSKNSTKKEESDVNKNKMIAILSYLIFFLPFLTDAKDSEFAKFHANQSLALLISGIVVHFVVVFLTIVTLGLFSLFIPFIELIFLGFVIMGMVNASNGEMKRLPIVGGFDILK